MTFKKSHIAVVRDKGLFVEDSFKNILIDNGIEAIIGVLSSNKEKTLYAYSFDSNIHTQDKCNEWIVKNGITPIVFSSSDNEVKNLTNLRYIKNLTEEEADIYIYDEIGEYGVNGRYFTEEVRWLESYGVKKLNVRINTPGGSVLDGISMFSVLINTSMFVTTYNDGFAASIGSVILEAGNEVKGADYSKVMIHLASVNGFVDDNIRKLIEACNDVIVSILSRRMKKTKEEVISEMEKETWYNSEEALALGLIDSIFEGAPKLQNRMPEFEILNRFTNKSEIKMKRIAAYLKMNEDSTEDSILGKVTEVTNYANGLEAKIETLKTSETDLKNKVTEVENTNKDLQAKVEAFEAKEKEDNKAKVIAIIEKAIVENKIDTAKKDEMVSQFEEDHAKAQMFVDAIVKQPAKASNGIIGSVEGSNPIMNESNKDWTIRDWEKKNPKGLLRIKNETPEVYEKLYNETYSK